MIRFSHEANSWQVNHYWNGFGPWDNISIQTARHYYDEGFYIYELDNF